MGEPRLRVRSPGKVNLFLRIVRRRPDGYHDLASLFQAIDLADTLSVALSTHDTLVCSDPTLPTDRSNLVWKAVDLFRKHTGLLSPISIHLEKRIPTEAGLGGGSSNAATMLWTLNQLHNCPASHDQLLAWSAEIGSDISFFLSQGTAYCTGRGEKIEPLPALPQQKFWIVKPPYGLSTPAVYKALAADQLPQRNPSVSLQHWLQGNEDRYNDLEQAAFALSPELASLRKHLLVHGCQDVLLCGSGSSLACFGSVPPPALPGHHLFPVQFINRSAHAWY
jgi:4-diphosphocytidyl-2-C-methyl-D-erythritol kinase